MNRVFLFLPLAIFLVMGVYFGLGLREDPSAIPSQMIDRPLPVFDLPGIADGEPGLASSDLAGHVSLLNVFGSWCPPCEIEHPMLMQISRSGRVPIYGVDWRDRPGDGAAWLARHGNPYQRVGDDAQGRLAIDLGITGAPESFLVDREGRVRFHHVGIIDETVWRDVLLPRIEALEAE
ncbi:thiol:disulfide interchange protein [Maricaulis sp. W15]|uniref:DsbE family thiol:disulfide interchange protein n=1 Tax=Maricaulis sp. W15 TaxID=1772333 RepID=UPI00094894D9|nr:DsbE family thiol:disulfide interchange protein [Maricaulis sp. W15]OLF77876.1 thiol:disulfide interchange protein [Maricaulis sp. W15]